MKKILAVLSVLLVAACAKSPESISASYVSSVNYLGWSCKQLGEESLRLEEALATSSEQQKQARSNDIAGVILLGLPVSSLSGGNIAPQIARYKGEKEAVRKAQIEKTCSA